MGRMRRTILGAFGTVALTAGVLAAQGIPADRSTFVTVSGPVSLPGITLPAGTYLFRLADSQASRNIVQIFDRDRTRIYATLLAIPATRPEPSDEAVVTFRETPSDRPPAVRYWYYAGETSGQEFAYPKDQAIRIATASGESVVAVDTSSSDLETMTSAEITRVEPGAAAQSPTAMPETQPAETQPAQPAPQSSTPPPSTPPSSPVTDSTPPPAATPSASAQETPSRSATSGRSAEMPRTTGTSGELPKTASELPLVGLLGFLALGAALGAHALRRGLIV